MTGNNLLKATGSTTKKATQQVAKVIRDESLEMIKSARRQVTGEFDMHPAQPTTTNPNTEVTEAEKQQKSLETTRRLEQLEAEIKQIRDQRQAQKDAEKQQDEERKLQAAQAVPTLQEPSTKRKRGMMGAMGKAKRGMKGQLDKLKRKSEIRMPPSG